VRGPQVAAARHGYWLFVSRLCHHNPPHQGIT
jgi:hypothetical protein